MLAPNNIILLFRTHVGRSWIHYWSIAKHTQFITYFWCGKWTLSLLLLYFTSISIGCVQSAPVCSGIVALQDSSYTFGSIKVIPDNQDNSISFIISSSSENLNQFYNATFTLNNSAGSATSNISDISEFYKICHYINTSSNMQQVLMMYRTPLTTFKMNQLLSLLTTLRILWHGGLY